MGASIAMIIVHHLGYWDYRGGKLGQAVLGCGIVSLAHLATAACWLLRLGTS